MARVKLDREFYRPKQAVFEPVVGAEGAVLGEVGRYEVAGSLYAVAFGGKRSKPDWHYKFRNAEAREAYIERFVVGLKASEQFKVERARKRAEFRSSLAVGDVLVSSWGYDQTNVDWYEVVKVVGPKSVLIRPIAKRYVEDGFLSGKCWPLPGQYIGEPELRRVGEGNSVSLSSYSSARPAAYSVRADGSREYASHYESHYA